MKFDVWSNDVSFANKMESTGSPDLVHISEETKNFLDDSYFFRDSEEVDGHKTYFILGKKTLLSSSSDHSSIQQKLDFHPSGANRIKNLSTTDIPAMAPSPTSYTSPMPMSRSHHNQSKLLSPSPVLNTRKRLASITETVSKFLSAARNAAVNNEQQKSLLEQRKPNPTIVICEESFNNNVDNNKGTKLINNKKKDESPLVSGTNIVVHNSSNDCDKSNDKLVPYNGSTPRKVSSSEIDDDEGEHGDGSSLNITDLRSYISQSRCDVSPFSRTGSNRSERSNRYINNYHHQRSYSQQSSLSPYYPPQEFAINLSPSRKDSGGFEILIIFLKISVFTNFPTLFYLMQVLRATAEDQVYKIINIKIP